MKDLIKASLDNLVIALLQRATHTKPTDISDMYLSWEELIVYADGKIDFKLNMDKEWVHYTVQQKNNSNTIRSLKSLTSQLFEKWGE